MIRSQGDRETLRRNPAADTLWGPMRSRKGISGCGAQSRKHTTPMEIVRSQGHEVCRDAFSTKFAIVCLATLSPAEMNLSVGTTLTPF